MRYIDGKWQDLGFLESVLRSGMTPHDAGRSITVVGSNGAMDMRDPAAFALALLHRHAYPGNTFRFVMAHSREDPERHFDATSIHLFGREDLFKTSEFGLVASGLHKKTWGQYPIPPNRQPVDFIRYGKLEFSRHQIDQGPWRRLFDRDYGLLIFHPVEIDGTTYGVWNECGFGELGTGLLIKSLHEPVLSRILRQQAEALVGSFHGMHPELGFEMAVKIWVPDPRKLNKLLDCVAVPVTGASVDKLPFQYQVELVAIAQADGTPKIWTVSAPTFEMERDGADGGWVRMAEWEKYLPKMLYDLVELLNGKPDGMSKEDLCSVLHPGSPRGEDNLRANVSRANARLDRDDPAHRAKIEPRRKGGYKLCLRPRGV